MSQVAGNFLNAIVIYAEQESFTVTISDSAHASDSIEHDFFIGPLQDVAYAEDIISVARDTP